MTLRGFYLERRRAELPVFMRVLRALPRRRSASAEQLVWTLVPGPDRPVSNASQSQEQPYFAQDGVVKREMADTKADAFTLS